MKIEKISENQIKFILTKADLSDRNIDIEELTSPSAKTQDLFREIMEQAMEECDFVADDAPLMVEAVPVALDGIMIIVTKLTDTENAENKYTLISQSKDARRFKRKSLVDPDNGTKEGELVLLYSFSALDDVILLAKRLAGTYHGNNALYKHEGRYFLILQNDAFSNMKDFEALDMVLAEYGQKHVSTQLSKYFVMEHGEPILKECAIKLLSKNL